MNNESEILTVYSGLQYVLLGDLLFYPELSVELELEDFDLDLQPALAAIQGYFYTTGGIDFASFFATYPKLTNLFKKCIDVSDDGSRTENHTRQRIETLKRQRKIERVQNLALEMTKQGGDLETVTALYEQMGEALQGNCKRGGLVPLGECIDDFIRNLPNKPQRIETGIESLDSTLSLVAGNFVVIGGRPSAGKTALSLQIAANMAKSGKSVVYFSLETDGRTLCNRLIANQLNVPLTAVKNHSVSLDELDRLADVRKIPLYLVEAAGQSVAWMGAQAARAKADVIFIDYLQLIHTAGAKDRYSAVTQISMQLHTMAQSTGIAVIALAQLNRAAADKKPTNADLKESGQIEQDADAIILLSADSSDYSAELTKNKEGQAPVDLELDFNKKMQQFICRN